MRGFALFWGCDARGEDVSHRRCRPRDLGQDHRSSLPFGEARHDFPHACDHGADLQYPLQLQVRSLQRERDG